MRAANEDNLLVFFADRFLNEYEKRVAQYALENSNLPFMKFELSNLNSDPSDTLVDIENINSL